MFYQPVQHAPSHLSTPLSPSNPFSLAIPHHPHIQAQHTTKPLPFMPAYQREALLGWNLRHLAPQYPKPPNYVPAQPATTPYFSDLEGEVISTPDASMDIGTTIEPIHVVDEKTKNMEPEMGMIVMDIDQPDNFPTEETADIVPVETTTSPVIIEDHPTPSKEVIASDRGGNAAADTMQGHHSPNEEIDTHRHADSTDQGSIGINWEPIFGPDPVEGVSTPAPKETRATVCPVVVAISQACSLPKAPSPRPPQPCPPRIPRRHKAIKAQKTAPTWAQLIRPQKAATQQSELGKRIAKGWKEAVDAFLKSKVDGSKHRESREIQSQRGVERSRTLKKLREAVQDVYEAKDNLSGEVIRAGIGQSISELAEFETDEDWTVEERALRGKARKILQCWKMREGEAEAAMRAAARKQTNSGGH